MKKIKLTLTSRRVLTSLYSAFGNPKKSYNALKISTIAGWLSLHRDTIYEQLKLLESHNFIKRVATPKNYLYTININLSKPFLLKKSTHEAYQALAKKRGKFSIFLVEKQGESSENTLQISDKTVTNFRQNDDKFPTVSIELNSSLNSIFKSSSKSSSLNTFDDDSCVATQAAEIEKLEARYGKALVAKYQKKLQSYKVKHHIKYLQACLANEYTLQEQRQMQVPCKFSKAPHVPPTPHEISADEFNVLARNFQLLNELDQTYDLNLQFTSTYCFKACDESFNLKSYILSDDLRYICKNAKLRTTPIKELNFDKFLSKAFKYGLNVVAV